MFLTSEGEVEADRGRGVGCGGGWRAGLAPSSSEQLRAARPPSSIQNFLALTFAY